MLVLSQKKKYDEQDVLYNSPLNNKITQKLRRMSGRDEIIKYSPEALVGVLIHSYLADPKASRHVTYEGYIHIDKAHRVSFDPENLDVATILRQDVIVELIGAAPQNLDVYSGTSTMFVDFKTSFQGYSNACEDYKGYMKYLYDDGLGYIRDAEVRIIRERRIKKYDSCVARIFEFAEKHYPHIYEILDKSFKKYEINM